MENSGLKHATCSAPLFKAEVLLASNELVQSLLLTSEGCKPTKHVSTSVLLRACRDACGVSEKFSPLSVLLDVNVSERTTWKACDSRRRIEWKVNLFTTHRTRSVTGAVRCDGVELGFQSPVDERISFVRGNDFEAPSIRLLPQGTPQTIVQAITRRRQVQMISYQIL